MGKIFISCIVALTVVGVFGSAYCAESTDELVRRLRKQASQSRQNLDDVSNLDGDIGDLLQVVKDSAVMDKSQLKQFEEVAASVKEVRSDRLTVVVSVLSGVKAADKQAEVAVDRALKENKAAADLMKAALEVSRLNAMKAKQASGLALLIQEQEALRGQTLLESRNILEGQQPQASAISELSQKQQQIAQGIGRVLEGQAPMEKLQGDAKDIVVVINNVKLLDALKKQEMLLKELKLLNQQAKQDAGDSEKSDSPEELAKDDPLSQKIAELNEKIEEQNEKIEEFGDEFDGDADNLKADGDFNSLEAEQDDLKKEAEEIAEGAEGDVAQQMEQAQEKMEQAAQQMQQGNFEEAAQANKEAQQMMQQAAQQQAQQLAQQAQQEQGEQQEQAGGEQGEQQEQAGGEQGEQQEQAGGEQGEQQEQAGGEQGEQQEQAGGEQGEQQEQAGGEPQQQQQQAGAPQPPQPGAPQQAQQSPQPPMPGMPSPDMPQEVTEVDDTQLHLMSNQLKLGRNVIEEKTWVKKAGADYERSVQQGMEQKAPPAYENQSQAYFEALAAME